MFTKTSAGITARRASAKTSAGIVRPDLEPAEEIVMRRLIKIDGKKGYVTYDCDVFYLVKFLDGTSKKYFHK